MFTDKTKEQFFTWLSKQEEIVTFFLNSNNHESLEKWFLSTPKIMQQSVLKSFLYDKGIILVIDIEMVTKTWCVKIKLAAEFKSEIFYDAALFQYNRFLDQDTAFITAIKEINDLLNKED